MARKVDEMISFIDTIYEDYYGRGDKYGDVIKEIKRYKNSRYKNDLISVLNDKINSIESFLGFESNIWALLFVIIGIYITIGIDMIIDHHDRIGVIKDISIDSCCNFLVIIMAVSVLAFGIAVPAMRKKYKKKNYYKLVCDVLCDK